MIPILIFDIETIPDVAGMRRLYPQFIALNETDLLQSVCSERFGVDTDRTFLPHHLQKVCAISCVLRAGSAVPDSSDACFKVWTLGDLESSEASIIHKFFKLIEHYTPQLVSWNGGGFDLPVLHYRALIHGIAAPRYWDNGEDTREFKYNNYLSRYHYRHLDLMDVLAAYQPRANAGLDEIAKLCGFAGKLGIDGSQVFQAVQNGRLDEVRNYCETDVINTYLIYTRFQQMRGHWSPEVTQAEQVLVRQTLTDAALQSPHWKSYLDAWV